MNIEWMIVNKTFVGFPARAERDILGMFLEFLVNLGHLCGGGATLWCRNLLLSPNNSTYGNLSKREWLVDDVTAVVSSDKTEHDTFGMILSAIWPIQALFVVGEATLWCRNPLLSPDNFT